MIYDSTLSKGELVSRLFRSTQKASFIGNEGSNKYTLWNKGNYFELTWPTLVGQTSFCFKVKETEDGCLIVGRFMPNHYMWIYTLVTLFTVPPIVFLITQALLPAYISFAFVLCAAWIHFAFAGDIGKRGNDIIENYIEENLLR